MKNILQIFSIVIVLFFLIVYLDKLSVVSDSEGARIAEDAIREATITCYSLDGVYPVSFESLKSKSNIVIDEEKYTVFYEVFADNIMPEITVVERLQ